jgi:hypothetical protein
MQSVPITAKVVSSIPISWRGVLDTTLCDKVCQLLAPCQWFSLVSSNKTDCHNITEILLKVALNPINQTKPNKIMKRKLQQWWSIIPAISTK